LLDDFLDLSNLDDYERIPEEYRNTYRYTVPDIVRICNSFSGEKRTADNLQRIRYALMASGLIHDMYAIQGYSGSIEVMTKGIPDAWGGWVHGWMPCSIRVSIC